MTYNFDPKVDDPENYRLGIFYFNPKDSRVLVPKRSRILGWTVNFARPSAILGIIVIVTVLIIVSVMDRW